MNYHMLIVSPPLYNKNRQKVMKKIYDLNNNVKLSYNKFVWWISNFNVCDILILLFCFRFLQLNNLLNKNHVIDFNVNPLNANLTKWSKTESFVGKSRPIV